jgi:hypothetical protein
MVGWNTEAPAVESGLERIQSRYKHVDKKKIFYFSIYYYLFFLLPLKRVLAHNIFVLFQLNRGTNDKILIK